MLLFKSITHPIKTKLAIVLLTIAQLLLTNFLSAQTITVYKANSRSNGLGTNILATGSTVAMPTAAAGISRDTFVIKNTGSSTLNLTGNPKVAVSGTNAAYFTVAQPSVSSIAANDSIKLVVFYNPKDSIVHTATLTVTSNSTTNSTFTIVLKGGGNYLYGAKWPPIDNGTYQISNNNVEAGRTGGRTSTIGLISLADKTTTYWGPSIDSSGVLQIKLSLDGSTYTSAEVFTYSASESDLPNGKVVWRGQTRIQNAISNTSVLVYTRATLSITDINNIKLALTDPTSIGLSEEVGGLLKINSSSVYFKANYFIEASTSINGVYTPYLDFYDAYPTPPGPLPGQGIGAAYSTISSGTYWKNLGPKLATNQIFDVNEGAQKTITTSYLRATDDEDLPLYPDSIKFVFTSNTTNNSPLVWNRGVLKRNTTILNKTDSFTLKDVQDGIISYTHDGSQTVYDEFQFSIKDSKKKAGS